MKVDSYTSFYIWYYIKIKKLSANILTHYKIKSSNNLNYIILKNEKLSLINNEKLTIRGLIYSQELIYTPIFNSRKNEV
ncbi:hypothetical protein EV143_106100 [Flavobacterium chryseum]|nr:hypothetical protein EV143_106100 [Flavobacterium sp. P3160]